MNQLSYTVLSKKIQNLGFEFYGSIDEEIAKISKAGENLSLNHSYKKRIKSLIKTLK